MRDRYDYSESITDLDPMTSAELASVVSDETGGGALVFADGPTLSSVTIGNNTTITGLRKIVSFNLVNPSGLYAVDTQWCLIVKTDVAYVITSIEGTCDANPTTEINANLYYADTFVGLANPVLLSALDTTNGAYSSGVIAVTLPASKCMYLLFDAAPDTATTQFAVTLTMDPS
jgi:hypothetical protein